MSEEFIPRQNIQWFPGHMTKTLRMMEADIRQVECIRLSPITKRYPSGTVRGNSISPFWRVASAI